MNNKKLTLNISDLEALHSFYMPMLKDGGLFVPTANSYVFNETLNVEVTMAFLKRRLNLQGTVVWLAPEGARGAGSGVGLRFSGEQKQKVKQYFEKLLADKIEKAPLRQAY